MGTSEAVRDLIVRMRGELLVLAKKQKCEHPSRFMAVNSLNQVIWLGAVEWSSDNFADIVFVELQPPAWGFAEFPVTLALEDSKGVKVTMVVQAPEDQYLQ